jgi:hypothetical protein
MKIGPGLRRQYWSSAGSQITASTGSSALDQCWQPGVRQHRVSSIGTALDFQPSLVALAYRTPCVPHNYVPIIAKNVSRLYNKFFHYLFPFIPLMAFAIVIRNMHIQRLQGSMIYTFKNITPLTSHNFITRMKLSTASLTKTMSLHT